MEIVRRFVDHWNETGDLPWTEIDPHAVFVVDQDAFLGGTYRGHEAIRGLLNLMADVYAEFRYEVDDIVDAGDAVLVLGRIHARGVQSGATGTQQGSLVLQVRDGLVVAYRAYLDRDEARAAIGLRERE